MSKNPHDTFVYHTGNECYKNYTRRTTSTEIPIEQSSEHEQLSANEKTSNTRLRSSESLREPPCASRSVEGDLNL